ncbi:cysteine hydrolase family protein [Streptomyces hoynatensis]|uniref:Cysteine hydrolase n=1 Tax=Streptomyces hoynatensis TaxID=1141874 RepID=A0A3A9Z8Z1_9ACTN|nr:isochorismatase family cysteine hydrolase [Streptomyces hoynatensis]RKN43757.1 cysteine hydrolase [Streptomyces hoynatensis]
MPPMDYTDPQWRSSALVLVDVQRDVLDDGALPVAGTRKVLPRLAELVTAFRAAGRPLVHVVRLYPPGGTDVDLPRRAAVEQGLGVLAPGTPGSRLLPEVLGERCAELDAELLLSGRPQWLGADEVALYKPRWSAFHRTVLEDLLRGWNANTVVVAGCNLPNCPRATLFDASERDLRSALVTDAVSGASPERLADLAGIGVRLTVTAEVVAELAGP